MAVTIGTFFSGVLANNYFANCVSLGEPLRKMYTVLTLHGQQDAGAYR